MTHSSNLAAGALVTNAPEATEVDLPVSTAGPFDHSILDWCGNLGNEVQPGMGVNPRSNHEISNKFDLESSLEFNEQPLTIDTDNSDLSYLSDFTGPVARYTRDGFRGPMPSFPFGVIPWPRYYAERSPTSLGGRPNMSIDSVPPTSYLPQSKLLPCSKCSKSFPTTFSLR